MKRRGVFVSPDRSFSRMLQVQLPVVNLKSLLQCINIDFGFLLECRRNPSEEGSLAFSTVIWNVNDQLISLFALVISFNSFNWIE